MVVVIFRYLHADLTLKGFKILADPDCHGLPGAQLHLQANGFKKALLNKRHFGKSDVDHIYNYKN